jgi:hypothetical protein
VPLLYLKLLFSLPLSILEDQLALIPLRKFIGYSYLKS